MASHSRVEDRETVSRDKVDEHWGERNERGWGTERQGERDEERKMKKRRNKGRKRFPSSLLLPPEQSYLRVFALVVPSA